MGQQLFRILTVLACLSCYAASGWTAEPPWTALSPAQQTILAPVKAKWEGMTDQQHKRLLAVAAKYPKLKPEQQQRFQKRLTTWSALTSQQRALARQNYRKLKRLPPKKQLAVKQKWLLTHPPKPPIVVATPDKLQAAP